MTTKTALFALLAALGLAACAGNDNVGPMPSGGGSAAGEGGAYCDNPPADAAGLEDWQQLCMPGR